MIAATQPIQRPANARLLVVDERGRVSDASRRTLVDHLRSGDLVVANDAATMPASLAGRHLKSGKEIEIRLAGRASLAPDDVRHFSAIVFGAGDFHIPTERRPAPPLLKAGDRLELGPLRATIVRLLDHPRLISLSLDGSADDIWSGIARHGRPIQYAHLTTELALWDVWTAFAAPPVAFEPPSAGFALDWNILHAMRGRGVEFATITHAAGISSTGDEALDAHLPFDEPYVIPDAIAARINRARADGRRIVAIGTTVVRALEHAGSRGGALSGGAGLATGRITAATRLRIVDAILSGVHESTTSHYQLLTAFVDRTTLERAEQTMSTLGFRTHEFGDSVLIERACQAISAPRSSSSALSMER